MCLIFFAINQHSEYPLIVAANRDEFYARKTAPLQDWGEIVGGRDLKQGGQWMALDKRGRFAALTNYRDPARKVDSPVSRGFLVSRFLESELTPEAYLQQVDREAERYEGFNLLLGDARCLFHYSNISRQISRCERGFFGLSNHLLDTPWPKLERGRAAFAQVLEDNSAGESLRGGLFGILADRQQADERELPSTGVPLAMEKMLSSRFICSPAYGTRASTVVTLSRQGEVAIHERRFGVMGRRLGENSIEFVV